MPRTTTCTWSVVPIIPLRESLRLRAHFQEIVVIFDACRDVVRMPRTEPGSISGTRLSLPAK